ncbi:DUF1493 family protein [Salmonella enterica subsp. enterica serovar Typhimurium]|nr:DUF1493 family protein [Salmonella enterica subsp. enterica serovar Typhimurium]
MVDNIEQQVYELVRPYAGTYLFNIKQVELTPEIDLDTDLSIDELEAEDLMNKFFEELNVERGNFRIETYFPNHPFFMASVQENGTCTRPRFHYQHADRVSKSREMVI